jgi:hypothetical protein
MNNMTDKQWEGLREGMAAIGRNQARIINNIHCVGFILWATMIVFHIWF